MCSPVFVNMALDGLERELRERYPKASALSRKAKVNLVRYADDEREKVLAEHWTRVKREFEAAMRQVGYHNPNGRGWRRRRVGGS